MLESVILMGGLGLVIGGVLALASKVFYVYVDPKVAAIDEVLPGANCGGCGYPGCSSNAEAIVAGKSSPDSCVAAGPEVAAAIAELMGVVLGEKEPEFAQPGCHYRFEDTDIKYIYQGLSDCRAAALVSGGMKVCDIGCLGLGSCVAVCQFGALTMGEDRLPKVDQEKCTGCGACERICPKHIIRLTSVTRRIIREYTEDQCVTPCQRACPTGIDIREYVRLVRNRDFTGAVQVIKERNPFPTVIGRICPAPCETQCRRHLVDEPVGINNLKRFVCDIEMDTGERVFPYKAPDTGKKVAVIGGGVEGLSTAFFTARLGHEPTIFESTSRLGGLLRVAISDMRLPQSVLDWDIEGILEMGVKVKTGAKAGKDFTIPTLLDQGYEAVFTATGGWDSRFMRGDGGEIASVFPGAYLLIDLFRKDLLKGGRIPCGRNVVIVGGGPELPRAVEMCKALGAGSITVVLRNDNNFDHIDDAVFLNNAGVIRVAGEGERLTSVTVADLSTNQEILLNADTLFIASGRFPELVFVRAEGAEEDGDTPGTDQEIPLKWEGVEVYKKPGDNLEKGLLSIEDEISGYSAAVFAINGGRKAAASIHAILYGIDDIFPANPITRQSVIQEVADLEGVEPLPRQIMPVAAKYIEGKDYFLGYDQETAVTESERCLRCGILCYERSKRKPLDEAL